MIDNVCKFSINHSSDLICEHFVLETRASQSNAARARANFICLVLDGEGILNIDGRQNEINRGTLFFINSGKDFSIKDAGGLKYFYVSFRGRRADELIERFKINDANRIFEGCESLIPFWQESQNRAVEGVVDLVCEAVLLFSLAGLTPSQNQPSNVIAEVVAITQNNFTLSELSISKIADELGYDAKYLSSLFKKKQGIPYTQYLRDLRIRRSVFLMEQGLVSVKNIAALSGFSDALYFSKVFASVEGIPPTEYIARLEESRKA